MAAALETLPLALTSKLELWLVSEGRGKSSKEITSHGSLLICGMPGHLL